MVSPSGDNFVVGIQSFSGNPYDGHTLQQAVAQSERLAGFKAEEIYVDQGYQGHNYQGDAEVHIARKKTTGLKKSLIKWLKRRSAIEPLIGHMKNNGRLDRNYLLGVEGDEINAILCGCGFNLRKLLIAFLFWLFFLGQKFSLRRQFRLAEI